MNLLPVETITVFAEARNAVSVKAIFKRKFRKTLQMRKFKADFEFNHQWITTSTPLAWLAGTGCCAFGSKPKNGLGAA